MQAQTLLSRNTIGAAVVLAALLGLGACNRADKPAGEPAAETKAAVADTATAARDMGSDAADEAAAMAKKAGDATADAADKTADAVR